MYDICVIGGGPGGYVAALRAAKQGAKTCLVEKDSLGGTCLNRGCIPTKTLLQTAHFYDSIAEMEAFGIHISSKPELDWTKAIENKDARVKTLVNGVGGLLKKAKVDVKKGEAHFKDAHTVVVGDEVIESNYFILATGSSPAFPPVPGLELPGIMNSDDALSIKAIPKSMLIMGGGVIGVELGQLFLSLGCDITIVEMESYILPRLDHEVSNALKAHLEKQGAKILTDTKLVEVKPGYIASVENAQGKQDIAAEAVLVVTGRKSENELALELGLKMNGKSIAVNENFQTSVSNIYAIGDVTGIGMLAHSASHHGIHAVDHALSKPIKYSHGYIPSCIYTTPELASVGMTEDDAKAKYGEVAIGRFPFVASGRALSAGKTEGFVKIIADKKYHEILGVHIVGANATEMIAEATLAMEMECTADELMNTIHAHPTMSEAVMEAAYQMVGMGIHI